MTNKSEIIRIRSDDCLFIITAKTLSKFPNSLFFKVINNIENVDFIFKDENTLYVDLRPENIKKIIDFMRGYKLYTIDESLKLDMERLGFENPELETLSEVSNDNYLKSINKDIPSENYAKSFFEMLSIPKEAQDTVTSMSELNDPLSSLNQSSFKIVRPKKEKIDT